MCASPRAPTPGRLPQHCLTNILDAPRARGPLTERATIDGLFGQRISLTASRADAYRSCPFAYFMDYGLRARARKPAAFAAPETGTFIHFVLENVLREVNERPEGADIPDADALRIMRRYIRQYIADYLGGLEYLSDTRRPAEA